MGGLMAYPILHTANTANSYSLTLATTRTITMPSGLAAGDLIVVIYHASDVGGDATVNFTTNLGSWTRPLSTALPSTTNKYGIFYKWSDGTESGLTVTASHSTSANIDMSFASAFRISGAEAGKTPTFAITHGSTNPPSVAAPWGSGENLFFSVVSHVQDWAPTVSTYPTGYSQTVLNHNLGTGMVAHATKQTASDSDDSGAYALNYNNTRTFGLAFVVGAGAPAGADSINNGNPVKVGQTSIPIDLSGFVGTPTSVLCKYASGTKSLTVSNIIGDNTAITVDLEDRSAGVDCPLIGSALEFTVTDGTGIAVINTTLAAKTGEVAVTFSNVITQYNTFFAPHFNSAGYTSEGAEFVYTTSGFTPSDFVLNADSSFSSTSGGVVTGWFRPSSGTGAGNVYYYDFTINDSGEIVTDRGLTSSGLTSSGLTRVGLTSAGL